VKRGVQVRIANNARENRGLAQNKPSVVKCVHGMIPHIRKTQNPKVV